MKRLPTIPVILLLNVATGCGSGGSRLASFAERTSREQSAQNQSMATLVQSAGDNHRRAVEAVEKSRQEVAMLHREVREQADQVDNERRDLASLRHRESLLAPAIESLGVLLVAALPLVISIYLLHGLRAPNDQEAASEVLIRELISQETPWLLGQAERQERIESANSERGNSPEEMPF